MADIPQQGFGFGGIRRRPRPQTPGNVVRLADIGMMPKLGFKGQGIGNRVADPAPVEKV